MHFICAVFMQYLLACLFITHSNLQILLIILLGVFKILFYFLIYLIIILPLHAFKMNTF